MNKKLRILYIITVLIAIAAFALAGYSIHRVSQEKVQKPTATATPQATQKPVPTATPTAMPKPKPTATPRPTTAPTAKPQATQKPSTKKNKIVVPTPDASMYVHPDDFYYDYRDDFVDFEEAEDWYYEHGGY